MTQSHTADHVRLAPQSGQAFELKPGMLLRISDPQGEQVADITAVSRDDVREIFSPGRTIDYNETIKLSVGQRLYSNRSRVMFTVIKDDVGVHDLLLTPCSAEMFVLLRNAHGHPSCLSNIVQALQPYGVEPDAVGGTLNAFMRVDVDGAGRISIGAPASRPNDELVLRAEMELVVAVTACSSEVSNNGVCKPIDVICERSPAAQHST